MTESGGRIVSNINRIGTEASTFPLVCETCLGDNPNVRMAKTENGGACKICERAFTLFRWKAGHQGRFKSTIVCQLCARMKNVCQCCLLDLEFGLPVQLRDKYLAENEHVSIPTSRAGIDYQVQLNARALEAGSNSTPLAIESGYAKLADNPHLQRIARSAPYFQRNEARVCTFFLKGECNRGTDCPFRHESVSESSQPKQNIYDRFHGIDDPVAARLEKKSELLAAKIPSPPADETISTLFLTGVPVTVDQPTFTQFLHQQFDSFGAILKTKIVPTSNCAFVEFEKRDSAEQGFAAKYCNPEFVFEGTKLRVHWARPMMAKSGTVTKVPYPSMDPANMGNAPLKGESKTVVGKSSSE